MPKRPHRWQLEKQRTAKAIRALPDCEMPWQHRSERCSGKAMGYIAQPGISPIKLILVCPSCAGQVQRAQRERT